MNILGEFDSKGYICIDMKQDNMLVIHPDFLVSGSVIAGATMCVRRCVSKLILSTSLVIYKYQGVCHLLVCLRYKIPTLLKSHGK